MPASSRFRRAGSSAPTYIPSPESVSLPCASYGELRNALDARLRGEQVLPNVLARTIESTVFQAFFKVDGLAHRRVADAILETLGVGGTPDIRKCARYLYGVPDRFRSRLSHVPELARWALGTGPSFSWRRLRSPAPPPCDQNFSVSAVSQLLQSIHAARHAESPRHVRADSAEAVGAYAFRKFRGRAIVLEAA